MPKSSLCLSLNSTCSTSGEKSGRHSHASKRSVAIIQCSSSGLMYLFVTWLNGLKLSWLSRHLLYQKLVILCTSMPTTEPCTCPKGCTPHQVFATCFARFPTCSTTSRTGLLTYYLTVLFSSQSSRCLFKVADPTQINLGIDTFVPLKVGRRLSRNISHRSTVDTVAAVASAAALGEITIHSPQKHRGSSLGGGAPSTVFEEEPTCSSNSNGTEGSPGAATGTSAFLSDPGMLSNYKARVNRSSCPGAVSCALFAPYDSSSGAAAAGSVEEAAAAAGQGVAARGAQIDDWANASYSIMTPEELEKLKERAPPDLNLGADAAPGVVMHARRLSGGGGSMKVMCNMEAISEDAPVHVISTEANVTEVYGDGLTIIRAVAARKKVCEFR